MTDGYGSTQATSTWISSDGSVTNYDPNTEMGFWISAFHNECDRSALLEREIERLRAQVEDCENDFHALKQIFDKVRAERDHES